MDPQQVWPPNERSRRIVLHQLALPKPGPVTTPVTSEFSQDCEAVPVPVRQSRRSIFLPKMHLIDWIWRARGAVELDPPLTPAEVFERLKPMLEEASVTAGAEGRAVSYRKFNPSAQDKLATFSSGSLMVAEDQGQSRLLYDLKSPALRLVFLAPFFFLAAALGTQVLSDFERANQQQEEAAKGKDKAEEEEEEEEPRNAIDVFLGAPEPFTLEEKKRRKEEKEKEDPHSSRPAYIFAGIFAALWILGRFLEPWLVRRTFRRALYPDDFPEDSLVASVRRSLAERFKKGSSAK